MAKCFSLLQPFGYKIDIYRGLSDVFWTQWSGLYIISRHRFLGDLTIYRPIRMSAQFRPLRIHVRATLNAQAYMLHTWYKVDEVNENISQERSRVHSRVYSSRTCLYTPVETRVNTSARRGCIETNVWGWNAILYSVHQAHTYLKRHVYMHLGLHVHIG